MGVQIPPETIAIYQEGGSAFAFFERTYNTNAAKIIAQAAATGDREVLTDAIAQVKYGTPLNDSTAELFVNQILDDPLDAPLDALDYGVNRIFDSSGVKTIVVVVVAGAVIGLIIYANTRRAA